MGLVSCTVWVFQDREQRQECMHLAWVLQQCEPYQLLHLKRVGRFDEGSSLSSLGQYIVLVHVCLIHKQPRQLVLRCLLYATLIPRAWY